MAHFRFTWDEKKNRANRQKHGVSFEEAVGAFADPLRIMRQDRIENGERRWQTIGQAYGIIILLVAHTIPEERPDSEPLEVIRIISARKATRPERKRYETEND